MNILKNRPCVQPLQKTAIDRHITRRPVFMFPALFASEVAEELLLTTVGSVHVVPRCSKLLRDLILRDLINYR